MSKRSYLLGSDSNQEDLCLNLLENLRKVSGIPICVADFGMTIDALEYIRHEHHHVDVFHLPLDGFKKAWHAKPTAMRMCHAEDIVWLDNDIEVLESIDELFVMVPERGIGLVKDWYMTRQNGCLTHNSGVVVVRDSYHNSILDHWIEEIRKNERIRGDQEALYALRRRSSQLDEYITTLPSEYNWTRLQMASKVTDTVWPKILHWTGPVGTKYMRENVL